MRLEKLFDIQRKLDERIVEKHGLQGEDLLDKKILALQVELGELANEWRGFKFWSEDQEPRTSVYKQMMVGDKPARGMVKTNPLLEEYVDCLHFIMSIGIEWDMKLDNYTYCNDSLRRLKQTDSYNEQEVITKLILDLMRRSLRFNIEEGTFYYSEFLDGFFALGEMLGFTWEEIEREYYRKNDINHERQEVGY